MRQKIAQLWPGGGCTGCGFGPDLEAAGSTQSVALRIDSLIGSRDPRVALSVSEVGVIISWGFTSDCSRLLTF